MSDIAKSLTKAVIAAEERAGTMPAKEAVKLRPSDWHTLCKTAREAATEITRLRQLLSEAETREREARAKALEEAAAIADTEEELPGEPSKLVVAAMEAVGPVGNARAAVRTTKASIGKRIRALQSEER